MRISQIINEEIDSKAEIYVDRDVQARRVDIKKKETSKEKVSDKKEDKKTA